MCVLLLKFENLKTTTMRHFLKSLLMCLPFFGFSQVPNFEFENWVDREIYTPVNWYLGGNATYTNDASSGNTAVLLENKNGRLGYVSNTIITEEELGEPYADFPLTARFSVKYDLAVGDTGKILAFFKSSGAPVGTVFFDLVGNSADTFTTFKYPIQWSVNLFPDSVIFVVASNDFDKPIDGDGYVIFDNIVFESFGTPNQQVANQDFENVDTTRIPHPEFWYTTNLIGLDLFGDKTDNKSVVQTDQSHHGIGMLVQNVSINNDLVPGVAVTGDELDLNFPPTFSVSKKWAFIQGYYKYDNDNIDQGVIYVIMYYQGTAIGGVQHDIDNAFDEITYFSAPIAYSVPNVTPDSAVVIIGCADFENPKGENTKLWIDKVTFANASASISAAKHEVLIFPNPAQNVISVSFETPINQFNIMDAYGRLVLQSVSSTIDVSSLNAGTYFIQFNDNGNTYTTKFIKL
jgi:hypothetical protein